MFNRIESLWEYFVEFSGVPEWLALKISFYLALLSFLFTAINFCYKFFNWILLKYRQRILNRDLAPYYTSVEINNATRFYIPSKYQNVAPSQDTDMYRSHIAAASNPLIPMFLKKAFKENDDTKYYLVLADTGMGKTTFMINLFLSYKNQWPWKKRFDIKLFPLGNPESLDEIEKIDDKKKKDTILLLDAFDEDALAFKDYTKRLTEILSVAWRFREIVITCRTQFFPSERELPYDTGIFKYGAEGGKYVFRRIYISVFSPKDIQSYLYKRYNPLNPFNWKKISKAKWLVNQSKDLIIRPMILSHIQDFVSEDMEKTFKFNYQLYHVLINKWVERESSKPGVARKFKSLNEFRKQLWKFSENLAVDLYQSRKKRRGLFLYSGLNITNKEILQILNPKDEESKTLAQSDWRSHSLLNRNATGWYKFSHKSILEFFLARKLFYDLGFIKEFEFEGFETTKHFLNEMVIAELIRQAKGTYMVKDFNFQREIQIFSIEEITAKEVKQIQSLNITSVGNLKIQLFELLNLPFFNELILTDFKKFPNLYRFYKYFRIKKQILSNLRDKLKWIEKEEEKAESFLPEKSSPILVKQHQEEEELHQVRVWLKNNDLDQLLNRLEFKYATIKEWENKLEIEEPVESKDALKIPQQIKENDESLKPELFRANEYITSCQKLQEGLKHRAQKNIPKVDLYY